jgi:hypothetical protein
MVVPLKANELVIKAGDGTYYIDNHKVTGKLVLTNQRIYFVSTNGHTGQHDLEIMPSEIQEVLYFNTRRILPNGLNVVLKSGEERKFSVRKRNEIGALINRMY